MLVAATLAPLVTCEAFQIWVICCPFANDHRTVQPFTVDDDVLVTLTSPWNPPCHWLRIVYATAQDPAGGGVVVTLGEGVGVGVRDGVGVGVGVGVAVGETVGETVGEEVGDEVPDGDAWPITLQ